MLKQTILGLVGDKLMQKARVASIERVTDHFTLIELESDAFARATWRPGEKIQINVGDWNVRTYTPLAIDGSRARILVYTHGNGPASAWSQRVRTGDVCQFIGPRSSLNADPNAILFGDETSFAVASTFQIRCVIEVSNLSEAEIVRDKLGLKRCTLVDKSSEIAAIFAIQEMRKNDELVLMTGNARSIQRVRHAIGANGTRVKAYWSPGKTGLD